MGAVICATSGLASLVTQEAIGGVFDEIKSLVPVILPTVIAFLAFRKGWSFLKGEVRSA